MNSLDQSRLLNEGAETMKKRNGKRPSKKKVNSTIWFDSEWSVVEGRLVPGPGRPFKTSHLFQYVAEKVPYTALKSVAAHMRENAEHLEGVYMAHDSMGVARYGGRGRILSRLATRKRKYPKELLYFSFYVIKDKKHERELETAILRAAGSQMTLNQRKVRTGTDSGSIRDYEPGTRFFERQHRKGRKRAAI